MIRPGGGAGSITYTTDPVRKAVHVFNLAPHVGGQLIIAIYFEKRATVLDHFTITDSTAGITRHAVLTVPGTTAYRHAEVSVFLVNQKAPQPAANLRLWKFTETRVVTYNGEQGSTIGPWDTVKLIDTVDGTATGTIVMFPFNTWNDGQNFSVWLAHR